MVQGERRTRLELRRLIESSPPRQKSALIFLSRGTGQDRLDELERRIPQIRATPFLDVKTELDRISRGAGARICGVLPGVLWHRSGSAVKGVSIEVNCLEDLSRVPRQSVLMAGSIGRRSVDALAQVMAGRGIYFKGEGPA